MEFTERNAAEIFGTMLFPNEKSLCPVYCTFGQTGFFADPEDVLTGYVTCTSNGRILFARKVLSEWAREAATLSAMDKLNVKKSIFGQYKVCAEFGTKSNKLKIMFQLSPKVQENINMPNQKRNTGTLVDTLKKYER